ncbi:MAG: TIGR04084 family radical SAM/SPASM domain-containing protein [Candidatus Heimdallarchaeota archaeon]|nr:TIGR04084 family radical SAM/SPASM domain-containing protein [Candidatus Heimdallarchaeota archaeon]
MILTRVCNLKCKYCGEDAAFEPPPIEVAYSLETLKAFLEQDEHVTIQFYGGEPLLRIPLLEKIMDTIEAQQWSVQTNGCFLHQLPAQYLNRLDAILVSIDGRREITDWNRGDGIYNKVLKNCRIIRERGFKGDLIARMATSEVADIYKEVTHLASLTNPTFDHIHWQLDCQWDDDPAARWQDFDGWLKDSYNPGISRLVRWWVKKMEEREFVGITPFIPVMRSILFNEPSKLRCGAGLDSFAINPSGEISVCPISPEFAFSLVGDIHSDTPASIRNSMLVSEPCPSCDIFSICGGRCLFANQTKLWGQTGFQKVCETVRHLVSELQAIKSDVLELIDRGVVSEELFNYPSYNNGCEIIP